MLWPPGGSATKFVLSLNCMDSSGLFQLCLEFILIKNRFVALDTLELVCNVLRDMLLHLAFSSFLLIIVRPD